MTIRLSLFGTEQKEEAKSKPTQEITNQKSISENMELDFQPDMFLIKQNHPDIG